MDTHADNQAMTEVALGLAMAFFAIMIISMVSMSVQRAPMPSASGPAVQVSAPATEPGMEDVDGALSQSSANDFFIVYYQGKYLDAELNAVSPKSLPFADRYVLAIDPALSFQEVMKVRTEIVAANLVITELNSAWSQRLRLQ